MKANELMIGDFVLDGNVYAQVTSITCDGNIETTHNEHSNIELIEPIPLTPEMLSKLGFEKKGNRYGIYDDYFDFDMYEYNDGTWLVSYHYCEMSLPDEQLLICYIHQLQHFMRHCGIEKTIEL